MKMTNHHRITKHCLLALAAVGLSTSASSQEMDKMWGESVVKLRAADAKRGQLFEEGNYAMFIHWGLYSQLANKVKGKTYYGIGVPFLARWPGKIAAAKVDDVSMISAVDLLPTFCEIAGAKLPDSYKPDSLSQVAALIGNGSAKREKPLFWQIGASWPPRQNAPNHWATHAIVDQEWKLLTNENSGHTELYDIVADPMEKNDLAAAKPEVAKALMEKLTQWKASLPPKPDPACFSTHR